MDTFRKGKFELLALTETKLKWKGEVPWYGVNGITAGVQEIGRAKEGVAILLNDVCHSALMDFGCVRSRIIWIKSRSSRVKVCVVVGYGPNEGNGKEMEGFWNELNRTVDRTGNGYRLCVMGNMNGWIGDRVRAGITDAFAFPGDTYNRRRAVEFCDERGLCG